MTSTLSSLRRCIALAMIVLLLGGAAWAQAPNRETLSPDMPKLRQPSPSSVQQQEDAQATRDKGREDDDSRIREMDRRLNRTLRSVCSGC
jgi:hypothetical protein